MKNITFQYIDDFTRLYFEDDAGETMTENEAKTLLCDGLFAVIEVSKKFKAVEKKLSQRVAERMRNRPQTTRNGSEFAQQLSDFLSGKLSRINPMTHTEFYIKHLPDMSNEVRKTNDE